MASSNVKLNGQAEEGECIWEDARCSDGESIWAVVELHDARCDFLENIVEVEVEVEESIYHLIRQ
ncbi:hypothetical protein ACLOJK_036519 [Asimina triloba]